MKDNGYNGEILKNTVIKTIHFIAKIVMMDK
jgi:hypothetical protein